MLATTSEPIDVVSPELYGLILSSSRLKQRLLPGGLTSSPYEVLTYDASLTIHDTEGLRGTFARAQKIRFLQDGVSAILDHLWGEGVLLTHYDNTAGTLEDSFKDQGKQHLLIALERAMATGETLAFEVTRTAMVSFIEPEEYLETIIDHPIRQLSQVISFPKARPCQSASLFCDGLEVPLPVLRQPDGWTVVRCEVLRPMSHLPYTIRWAW